VDKYSRHRRMFYWTYHAKLEEIGISP
jgi:hypothetical protein